VPLMAMLRHRANAIERAKTNVLLYSSRTQSDILYRGELVPLRRRPMAEVCTLTRESRRLARRHAADDRGM